MTSEKYLESALLVVIPEAEPLLDSFRAKYDPSAALGIPAHVTILTPFIPPLKLTPRRIQQIAWMFAQVPRFSVAFSELRRFPNTLYLAPIPEDPFKRLIETVVQNYPERPPYGGQFTEIIPHMTIADLQDLDLLDQVAVDFKRAAVNSLPIVAEIRQVLLIDINTVSKAWREHTRFPLGEQ